MEVAIIGTGRCGTSSMQYWIPGSVQERFSAPLGLPFFDKVDIIRRMADSCHVEPRLGRSLGIAAEVWPNARFVWMRRPRDETVASMARFGFYRSSFPTESSIDLTAAAFEIAPDRTWSQTRKCGWLYDSYMDEVSPQWDRLDDTRKLAVALMDMVRLPGCRRRVAEFIGRPELADVPFPKVNATEGAK